MPHKPWSARACWSLQSLLKEPAFMCAADKEPPWWLLSSFWHRHPFCWYLTSKSCRQALSLKIAACNRASLWNWESEGQTDMKHIKLTEAHNLWSFPLETPLHIVLPMPCPFLPSSLSLSLLFLACSLSIPLLVSIPMSFPFFLPTPHPSPIFCLYLFPFFGTLCPSPSLLLQPLWQCPQAPCWRSRLSLARQAPCWTGASSGDCSTCGGSACLCWMRLTSWLTRRDSPPRASASRGESWKSAFGMGRCKRREEEGKIFHKGLAFSKMCWFVCVFP